MVDPVDEGIRLRTDFSGQSFTPAQARLYTDTYVRILRRLAEEPDGAVDFGFLAPDPEPLRTGRPPVNVVRAFEERARRAPGAQAVVSEDVTWTYEELDAVASRFAAASSRRERARATASASPWGVRWLRSPRSWAPRRRGARRCRWTPPIRWTGCAP